MEIDGYQINCNLIFLEFIKSNTRFNKIYLNFYNESSIFFTLDQYCDNLVISRCSEDYFSYSTPIPYMYEDLRFTDYWIIAM